MNARNALLVAIAAVLAGGASWLARGIDERPNRVSNTTDGSTSAARADSQSAGDSQLAPSTSSIDVARAIIGDTARPQSATQAAAQPTRLRVRVLRPTPKSWGVPVSDARVEIVNTDYADGRPGWTVLTQGRTDAGGLFSFDAPGPFCATVRAEATVEGRALFGLSGMMVAQSSETLLDVRLADDPRADTHATVLDRDTLLPIAGADVRPVNGSEPTTTNALGQFSVPLLHDDLTVWIGAAGYFPVVWYARDPRTVDRARSARRGKGAPIEAVPPPAAPEPSSMFLHRSARFQGTVVDARGRSIAAVRLKTRVHFGDDPSYETREIVTESDDRGRFAFDELPAGLSLPFTFTARGETVRADVETVELAPGETRVVMVRIRGHVELSGRVLDGRDELVRSGGIQVSIEGRTDASMIRSDGTYYLPFAVAGNGWIAVQRESEPDERIETHRVPISIPFDIAEWSCDVRLTPATSIAGVFLDAESAPVGGVVSLMRGATAVEDVVVRGERGEFRFEAVAAGAYTLRAIEGSGSKRSVQVAVHAGDQNVLVRLPPQGLVVGRVVDASGTAVSGAHVTILPSDGLALGVESAPDGRFRSPTPIGSVCVSVKKGDLHSLLECVAVGVEGESTVPDLVLGPSAVMRFTAGRLTGIVQVEVRSGAGLCFTGTLESYADRRIRVRLGEVRVIVTHADKPPETRVVEVRAGETAVVPIAGVH